MFNEYIGFTQEQLISGINEAEQKAKDFYEQRSAAEKQGRQANKKAEGMRKALTDLLLSSKSGKK